jgi:nucleoside-diphosphate-sugar epimerase
MKVIASGQEGFLLRNTLTEYDWEMAQLGGCGLHKGGDLVIHFASPSDSDGFKDSKKLLEANFDMVVGAVMEARRQKCKLIFASSMAADTLENDYGALKRAAELYIQSKLDNYVIMKIPRVYGADRNKGLMKKIKEGNIDDWDKVVEYIDIDDFKQWFDDILNKNGIQYYNNKFKTNTIKEIKEKYCES